MKFIYHIEGMHCANCVDKVKAALESKINIVQISLDPPHLIIEADTEPAINSLNSYISAAGKYRLHPQTIPPEDSEESQGIASYYPLILIFVYITGTCFINNFHHGVINWQSWMSQFMAGFFLIFSAFKLLDLRGFANGYSTYDLLAQRIYGYGYIYPFLELGLGILYLGLWIPAATQLMTIVLMGFSSLGVIYSLVKKQKFKCACLGTIFNVPLSSVTLVEDLSMVLLAAVSYWY